jgi:hypothetical protein
MKAHLHLVRYAIKSGHTVSVFDGECWAVKRSKSVKEVIKAIESVDESSVRFRDAMGTNVGYADIHLDNAPEETVYDFSVTTFMDAWWERFNAIVDAKSTN